MAKPAVAANLSSRHHQALSPHPRELARKEAEAAEAAEAVEKEVEGEEAQARPGVEVGPAEVVEVGTMEAEAQEVEVALVAEILVTQTAADGAPVEEGLTLALAQALLAPVVLTEEVLAEGILVIQCSAPDHILALLSHLPWAALEDLMVRTWEAWNSNSPSCCLQTVLVQTLELPLLSHQVQGHQTHPVEPICR